MKHRLYFTFQDFLYIFYNIVLIVEEQFELDE